MNDVKEMTLEEREATLGGIGSARKRKEDARFIRGKGNYVDDIKLPGMVYGDFVRSPYAHAKIKSINTEAALAVPGVAAVITAKDLEPLGLHWMPTLAGDVAAVLADKKVHFQNQEVAFVVGADRYAVADGVQAVEVEYEELPVLVDPPGDVEILPGMVCTVQSVLDLPPELATIGFEIPMSAIHSPSEEPSQKSFVWVIAGDPPTASRREIETLDSTPRGVRVSGLEPGERIVTAGVHFVRDGQEVRLLD